ncbi:hypothetical protein TVAG_190420 [Trichomonas vaginalis G3]|uniref:Uncharacterized protein n=1 Tax=Trichomonas vaginalis (strain ATCC PRA-98 / G3) TaxID=412133 RepID=A2DKH0_TRIV3|nr:hypothetical protein TVAGG3_0996690 [Trichomonas vaginalis G3]EAY19147.1 hypothetical protein TVAG_190420 [Trichomonas vaginalis G3]KAI5490445.1 hypothetical protein TVAGG3_0996690 [Trichomonas vaginalis G3]|eukprot:XP_001580133.1 hypothetical protein [Trichomonas vaginalis G3]
MLSTSWVGAKIYFKAEKVNKDIETQGFVIDNNNALGYIESYSFGTELRAQYGRYEYLIDETPIVLNIQKSRAVANTYFVSHECKDILYNVGNDQWEEFPIFKEVTGTPLTIKSKSGTNSLKIHVFYTNFIGYDHFDIILNPENGKVYVGETSSKSEKVVFSSWYPMNFKEYFNYTAKMTRDYPVIGHYTNYPFENEFEFQNVFYVLYEFTSQSTFTFGGYDFKSLLQDEQTGLNRGIYHVGSEPLIKEGQQSDIEHFTIFNAQQKRTATISFKEDELRIIVLSSRSDCYSLLMFKNAHEFICEDGSPVNPAYSSQLGEIILNKIKPRSGSPTLEIQYDSQVFNRNDRIDIVYNMFDIAVKFSSKSRGKMFIMSSVESEIYIIRDLGNSIYMRRGTFFKIDYAEGILDFYNLSQLPVGAQIGRLKLNNCISEFDHPGLVIRDGEVKTFTIDELSVDVYPYHYQDDDLCHFYSENEVVIKKIDNGFNLRSNNGPQNVTVVMEGLYENTFADNYNTKSYKFGVDAISNKPLGYKLQKSNIH